jgi:hypothetical protein
MMDHSKPTRVTVAERVPERVPVTIGRR